MRMLMQDIYIYIKDTFFYLLSHPISWQWPTKLIKNIFVVQNAPIQAFENLTLQDTLSLRIKILNTNVKNANLRLKGDKIWLNTWRNTILALLVIFRVEFVNSNSHQKIFLNNTFWIRIKFKIILCWEKMPIREIFKWMPPIHLVCRWSSPSLLIYVNKS